MSMTPRSGKKIVPGWAPTMKRYTMPVIKVENLGKKYILGHQKQERYTALRDVIANGVKSLWNRTLRPFNSSRNPLTKEEEFWALKDINLEINQGDRVGIIGRNGAGKSTLLKILSRITEPTTGRITIKGRVASLLEVGTGFHPELTGRENIFLNGAVLGMGKAEIKRKFDEIVAFAEIEKFLDTPVKRYSSGMYVRLAFAVAAHLEPEILLVDEVLAVGDVQFQKKCLGKMGDVAKEGRTVLFVSHNMGAVRRLCTRGIFLGNGCIQKTGSINGVVEVYLKTTTDDSKRLGEVVWPCDTASEKYLVHLVRCSIKGLASCRFGYARTDEEVEIDCTYDQSKPLSAHRVVFTIITQNGDIAFSSTDHSIRNGLVYPPGRYRSICRIPPNLLNRGLYTIRVRIGIPDVEVLVPDTDACCLTVEGLSMHGSDHDSLWPGAICPRLSWRVEEVPE